MAGPEGGPGRVVMSALPARSAASRAAHDRAVLRIVVLEGVANLVVLLGKVGVGLATGSLTILGDALHSATDLANNLVAIVLLRLSRQPPDREHPYGHRKFETLGVFWLATLLTVVAFELVLRALGSSGNPPRSTPLTLGVMVGLLVVNTAIAGWQFRAARRLDSDLLRADARHTFADALTTVAVIVGWQVASRGAAWVDAACALGVAALVLWFAFGLFRRAVPILVDRIAFEPEELRGLAERVEGVRRVLAARSRRVGPIPVVDVRLTVDAHLDLEAAHRIAERVEGVFQRELGVEDVTVHLEPEKGQPGEFPAPGMA